VADDGEGPGKGSLAGLAASVRSSGEVPVVAEERISGRRQRSTGRRPQQMMKKASDLVLR
jgi:hypothetical protein